MITKKNCPKCAGSGKITIEKKSKCPVCHGMGSTKIIVGSKSKGDCKKCSGTGKITQKSQKRCDQCKGIGTKQNLCIICGEQAINDESFCNKCKKNQVIYQLVPPVSIKGIEFNKIYSAKLVKKTDFGYFVQLAPKVEGLIRDKNYDGREGTPLFVKLKTTKGEKLEFQQINIEDPSSFSIKRQHDDVELQKIKGDREVGSFISLIARVENTRQIPRGPKVFTLLDETGTIEAAAFNLEGYRTI
ncbi:MAG: hypothetical protein ACW964_12765 [Candidatus Hodarchaeales archaeon]